MPEEGKSVTLYVDVDDGKIKTERSAGDDWEIVVPSVVTLRPSDLVGKTNIYELFEVK